MCEPQQIKGSAMITASNQTSKNKKEAISRKSRSYGEIIEFLDSLKLYQYSAKSMERMKP